MLFTDGMDLECFGIAKANVLAEGSSHANRLAAAARGVVAEEHVDVVVDTAKVVKLSVLLEGGQVVIVLLLVRSHSPRAPDLVLYIKRRRIYLLIYV